MAECGAESSGMRTLRRAGWLLFALALATMGADSTKARKDDFDWHDGLASGHPSSANHDMQPQNHYPRLVLPHISDDPSQSNLETNKHRFPLQSQFSPYIQSPLENHPRIYDRRRRKRPTKGKRRGGKKKIRVGRHEKSGPANQRLHSKHHKSSRTSVEPRKQSRNRGYRTLSPIAKAGLTSRQMPTFKKETPSHHLESSVEQSTVEGVLPLSEYRQQTHGAKHDPYLDLLRRENENSVLTSNHDRGMSSPANVSPLPYRHDPFLNPPANRYDPEREASVERPPPATTTALPYFVPDGVRPVIPDPTFLEGKSKVVAHEGGVALLPCAVKNLEMNEVSWGKVGREHILTLGKDVWVRESRLSVKHKLGPEAEVSHWDLKLKDVELEDEGTYQCQVIFNEKLVRTVELIIVEKPPYNPVITIEGKKFVESAQTAYIRCNATEGNRSPDHIDWFKNGDKIDSVAYPNIMLQSFRTESSLTLVSELAIMKASAGDSGTYICRSSAQLIASLDLNVLVADKSNVKRGNLPSDEAGQADNYIGAGGADGNGGKNSTSRRQTSFLSHTLVLIVCFIWRETFT